MEYEAHAGYRLDSIRTYCAKENVFQLPVEKLESFEAVLSGKPPPHDSRVLTTADVASLDPPAPDCSTWVEDVLAAAQKL